jgi:hypothetical protein
MSKFQDDLNDYIDNFTNGLTDIPDYIDVAIWARDYDKNIFLKRLVESQINMINELEAFLVEKNLLEEFLDNKDNL